MDWIAQGMDVNFFLGLVVGIAMTAVLAVIQMAHHGKVMYNDGYLVGRQSAKLRPLPKVSTEDIGTVGPTS